MSARHSFKVKWVGRHSPREKLLHIGRSVWQRGTVGDGDGYSTKVSVGLHPSLFHFSRGRDEWHMMVAGLRLHDQRAYGGIHV